MSRKFYAAFAPLVVAVAFVVMPATSQAAYHWYSNGVRLPFNGAKVAVATHGTLTLANAKIGTLTCTVKDKGNIWNASSSEPGKDEITEFVNHPCSSEQCPVEPEVIAEGLPWPTELAAGPRIKIAGIKVRVICDSLVNVVFSGSLSVKFINNEPSYAEFDSESGTLENSELGTATVTGKDYIEGPEGDVITVKSP